MKIAKRMLTETNVTIAQIAANLTFDPSNFTKFFKHFEGITPKQFRDKLNLKTSYQKTETLTIKN